MNVRVRLPRVCTVALAAGLMAGLMGCQLGPGRLKVSSAHYSDAVRVAQSEQLLANLVRLRYRDLPVFLNISNISTQFEFETAFDASGTIMPGGSDSASIGAGVRYSERPTISFAIMGGESFQKRMLKPLRVAAISLLAESGWRAKRILRLTVEGLNGLKNAPTASGPTPGEAPRYREFQEATALIDALTRARLIDFEYETRYKTASAPLPIAQIDGGHAVDAARAGVEFKPSAADPEKLQVVGERRTLVMRFSSASDDSADAARLRDLLRLKRHKRRFDVVAFDESAVDPFEQATRLGELLFDTRSLMGVLYYLSNGVQAPQEHLDAGFATATVDAGGTPFDWSTVLGGLFEVRSSKKSPPDPAVAVRHRGRWFYIADDDETSKSTFLLLNQLFTLQAGDVEEVKPVLTLPVGR